MAQGSTKTLNSPEVCKLPPVARRLIEKNREKRLNGHASGDFCGRFAQTLSYLRWKAACHTLSDAIGYIASELERERLYALYRKLFPQEWRKSHAKFKQSESNECHTERELEFIELVSDRYFPLCTWLDWSDYRFDHIPIESVNYDFCCDEYEWQEFRPCLQFAINAFLWRNTDPNDENWREILAHYNVRFESLPPISQMPPPFSVLDEQRHEPKIRRFRHLIEFLYHDTGNPFIDTTYCQPMDLYEWTEENLERLKSAYGAVDDYFASLESIDASIERNALSTFKELVQIWNTGRLTAKKRPKELPGNTDDAGSSGLLINILAADEEGVGEAALLV